MRPVRFQKRRLIHTEFADRANPIWAIDERGAVLDHRVHHRRKVRLMHYCAECGHILDVDGGHKVGVDACPQCGSTRVSAIAGLVTAHATVHMPSVRVVPASVRTVLPTSRTVRTYPPGDDGSVMVEVCDDNGDVIATGVGSDEDDALLGMIEELRYRPDNPAPPAT
jgi:hypothetical protein